MDHFDEKANAIIVQAYTMYESLLIQLNSFTSSDNTVKKNLINLKIVIDNQASALNKSNYLPENYVLKNIQDLLAAFNQLFSSLKLGKGMKNDSESRLVKNIDKMPSKLMENMNNLASVIMIFLKAYLSEVKHKNTILKLKFIVNLKNSIESSFPLDMNNKPVLSQWQSIIEMELKKLIGLEGYLDLSVIEELLPKNPSEIESESDSESIEEINPQYLCWKKEILQVPLSRANTVSFHRMFSVRNIGQDDQNSILNLFTQAFRTFN